MIKNRLLVALLVAGSSATLAEQAPPAQPREPRICREAEQNLGSHIRAARRCLTAEQWQREDEAKARAPLSLRVTEGQDVPSKPPR